MEPSLHVRFFGSFDLQYPGDRDGVLQPLLMPATLKSQSLLAQSQGQTQAARQMLAEAYGQFDEGFDTCDLQQAAALLETLS